jgi:16S rRNA (guanine527-N7)-methyltransferase
MPDAIAYEIELATVLPEDLPNRQRVISVCAAHLGRISEINPFMNLTRVVDPREAALKHVLDSLFPWRELEGADTVLDLGTGPGFPGIPLAAALPGSRFTLAESTKKKAQFVDDSADAVHLDNVKVLAERGEDILRTRRFSVTVARAVAPLPRLLKLLGPHVGNCGKLLLYKGPDAETELAEAAPEIRRLRLTPRILRYELPFGTGSRTMIELTRKAG